MGVLITLALAAPPGVLSVSPEAPGAAEQYRAWARGRGRVGEAAEIACRPLAEEGPRLCLRNERDGVRRYVSRADLASWGLSFEEAEALAAAALAASPWEERTLSSGERWWEVTVGDVVELAALSRTGWLPGELVAAPSRDNLIAWRGDGGELDHLMSVAVRRAWEEADDPVSPVVLRFSDGAWSVFGQARPADEVVPSAPPEAR